MVYATVSGGSSRNSFQAVSEEGSSFFIPKEVFSRKHLHLNQELSEKEFFSLKDECENLLCYNKALSLLASREYTRFDLKRKLLLKKFDSTVIDKVLDALIDEGSLDEKRFAEAFIISRVRRAQEGKPIMQLRLIQKGVPRDIADKILSEKYTQDFTDELIRTNIKRFQQKQISEQDIKFKLLKLGFTSYEIRRVFEEDF
ncbi:MAG: regulatory protein RecX [Sphaerochaetaceae bacterium]